MKNFDFEKHLREQADMFTMEPGPGMLEKVMGNMEKKRKRRGFIWFWLLLPAFFIGAILVIAPFFSTDNQNDTLLVMQDTADGNADRQPATTLSQGTDSRESGSGQTISSAPGDNNGNTREETGPSGDNAVPPQQTGETRSSRTTTRRNDQPVKTNNTGNDSGTASQQPIVKTQSGNPLPPTNATGNETGGNTEIRSNTVVQPGTNNTVALQQENTNRESFQPVVLASASPLVLTSANRLRDIPPTLALQPDLTGRRFRFSVGAYFSAGAVSSRFRPNANSQSMYSESYAAYRRQNETFHFSYAAGLNFRYSPVKWLALETGIGYSRFGSTEKILNTTPSALDLFADTVGFSPLWSTVESGKEYTNTYEFITIPLKIYAQHRWKVIGVEAGVGIAFKLPVAANAYTVQDIGNALSKSDLLENSRLNTVGIDFTANLHAVFSVNRRVDFFVGPTFRYRINALHDDDYIMRQHPYFIGAEIGIRINF